MKKLYNYPIPEVGVGGMVSVRYIYASYAPSLNGECGSLPTR